MIQNLRLFHTKYQMDGESVDMTLDNLQFRKLRETDIGARVILECTLAVEQQPNPQVGTEKISSVRLRKHYAQILGPGLNLENIEILEIGESDKVSESGTDLKTGSRVVLSATNLPLHGWGKAVGYREL